MKLILKSQLTKLAKNNKLSEEGKDTSYLKPVLKLFAPWGGATWLITEMDERRILFGLCDLGMGCPELGYVSLDELEGAKGPFGLKIERDMHFEPNKTLAEYADEARALGRINA